MPTVESLTPKLRPVVLFWLAVLAAVAYMPAQLLPFITDDYTHIAIAREFGPVSGWDDMARHPLYRFRALSSLMAYWIESLFGLWPLAFSVASLLLHILSTWFVAALGSWKRVGWHVSVPAAAFFAVAEGHQEAVIWFAAVPELHVFIFVLASFLLWVRWLQNPMRRWHTLALLAFVFALLAKESAVCFIGLQALAVLAHHQRTRRHWLAMLPFLLIAAGYFALIYSTRSTHQHFNDGTFSLSAPVGLTLLNSMGRLLWVWGFGALAVLWYLRRRAAIPVIAISIGWVVVGLGPYSFLTYMTRVPSRHTYIASAGLALLAGAAFFAIRVSGWKWARAAAAVLAFVVVAQNVGYLWTRKQQQYVQRAAPTEDLVRLARTSTGTIVVHCFPYSVYTARDAVLVGAGQPPSRLRFRLEPDCNGTHRYSLEPSRAPQPAESRTGGAHNRGL